MLVKIHKSYREIVAVCDNDLIGKTFEEGKIYLEIKESFYKGDEIRENELTELMKTLSDEDATFNIVGKDSTNTALKAGIITKDGIKTVEGIPFALVLM